MLKFPRRYFRMLCPSCGKQIVNQTIVRLGLSRSGFGVTVYSGAPGERDTPLEHSGMIDCEHCKKRFALQWEAIPVLKLAPIDDDRASTYMGDTSDER